MTTSNKTVLNSTRLPTNGKQLTMTDIKAAENSHGRMTTTTMQATAMTMKEAQATIESQQCHKVLTWIPILPRCFHNTLARHFHLVPHLPCESRHHSLALGLRFRSRPRGIANQEKSLR